MEERVCMYVRMYVGETEGTKKKPKNSERYID